VYFGFLDVGNGASKCYKYLLFWLCTNNYKVAMISRIYATKRFSNAINVFEMLDSDTYVGCVGSFRCKWRDMPFLVMLQQKWGFIPYSRCFV
jgi:hypothetical protein